MRGVYNLEAYFFLGTQFFLWVFSANKKKRMEMNNMQKLNSRVNSFRLLFTSVENIEEDVQMSPNHHSVYKKSYPTPLV